jgi:hypothetical protein
MGERITSRGFAAKPQMSDEPFVFIRVDSWLTGCAGHRTRGHCALSALLTVSQLSKSFARPGALRRRLAPGQSGRSDRIGRWGWQINVVCAPSR